VMRLLGEARPSLPRALPGMIIGAAIAAALAARNFRRVIRVRGIEGFMGDIILPRKRCMYTSVMPIRTTLLAIALCLCGCNKNGTNGPTNNKSKPTTAPATKPVAQWRELFDARTLANWKTAEFGAHGDPEVKNGAIILPVGDPMTGITWSGAPLPTMDYEVSYECQRLDGSDFFGTLTFPVRNSFASLVVGGWGGGVCGISSLDGDDAARNSTTTYKNFENNRWYKIRLRVTHNRLEAWLQDEQIVNVDTGGKIISTRSEVDHNKPFGFSSYQSTAAIRNIRIRNVDRPESKLEDF
jgi:hypothetical protein